MPLAFKPELTADNYLADELARSTRHEFVDGQVYAMAGAGDAQPFFKQHPCLVVEVLSPSTESIDRREKMLAYRTVPSLRDYLLISQEQRRVELYRRGADGGWASAVVAEAGDVALECVQANLTLEDIYEDVKLVQNVPLALTGLA